MDKQEREIRKKVRTIYTGESTPLFTAYEVEHLVKALNESRKREASKVAVRIERKFRILFRLMKYAP